MGNSIGTIGGLAVESWGYPGEQDGARRTVSRLYFARVTTTPTTSFGLLNPRQYQRDLRGSDPTADTVTIDHSETGDYSISSIHMYIPEGLVATDGDRLRISTVVGTGGEAPTSAVAASSTFAEGWVEYVVSKYETPAAVQGDKTADTTLNLFSENGGGLLGSGISVASGTLDIPIIVTATFEDVMSRRDGTELLAQFTRALEE